MKTFFIFILITIVIFAQGAIAEKPPTAVTSDLIKFHLELYGVQPLPEYPTMKMVATWAEAIYKDVDVRSDRMQHYGRYFQTAGDLSEKERIMDLALKESKNCENSAIVYNQAMSKYDMEILMLNNIRPSVNIGWCNIRVWMPDDYKEQLSQP